MIMVPDSRGRARCSFSLGLMVPMLLLAPAASRAGIWTGRVLEKAGLTPVPGASVQAAGSGATARTDSAGRFRLTLGSSGVRAIPGAAIGVRREGGRLILSGADRGVSGCEWIDLSGARAAFVHRSEHAETIAGGMVLDIPGPDFVGFLRVARVDRVSLYRVIAMAGNLVSFREYPHSSPGTSLPKSGAMEVTVSVERLLPKTLNAAVADGDFGDIVLEYPPRKLDVGAPPVYGAIVLFPQESDSAQAQAKAQAEWMHADSDWRRSRNLPASPVTWKILPDPEAPAPYHATWSPCCLPRDGSPKWGFDDIVTKRTFRDYQLHLEFNMMGLPDGNVSPTGYCNSGIVLGSGGWNEIQIETPKDPAKTTTTHDMASLLDMKMPDVFPYRVPGKWQAYDIVWRSPRAGEKGRVTVHFNGVIIHANVAWGSGTAKAPLLFQNELGSDVRFRNVWLKELDIKEARTDSGF